MSSCVLKKPHSGDGGNRMEAPRRRSALSRWVIAALVSAGFLLTAGYTYANKPVVLAVDGKEVKVRTFARTVGGFLQAQKLIVSDKDEIIPGVETPLRSGMTVTVNHALPVSVAVDGRNLSLYTRRRTVGEFLDEYGITPGPEDEVEPGLNEPVTAGMAVHVARVRTETAYLEAPVQYRVVNRYTTKLPSGATRVAREGSEGVERQTWLVTYRDGQEAGRKMVDREVIVEPVDKIMMVGSGWSISRGGENIRYAEAKEMLATAYSHTGYNTASGVAPHYGVAAVDPGVIPMGTRLYVDGYGYATALDRGSAIRGNRIDLFFDSYEEAVSWGRRRVKVYTLD
ncbi:MAG: ubiquitin-like domain-containing protein [Firmicutes bacterium]|nr:ubiquitin-like domain-containing protein [Bacillota bacterium]